MWVIYNKRTSYELALSSLGENDHDGVQALIDRLDAKEPFDTYAARWEV